MGQLKRNAAGIVFSLFVAGVTIVEGAEQVRIAIIPGEGDRAPKAGIVDLLTVELSKQDDVVLLEREQIRKVLTEHRLTAAGRVDPTAAVKLGELLAVDLFVFVEKLPKVRPALLRIQIVEARTGIVMGGMFQYEKSLDEGLSELASNMTLALAKSRTQEEDRRYVGILGFRSEELGHSLDGVAASLGMFLETDLSRSPTVIVLNRDHLTIFGLAQGSERLPCVLLGDHLITAANAGGTGRYRLKDGQIYRWKGQGGIFLHANSGRPSFVNQCRGERIVVHHMVKLSEKEALLADRSGRFWKLTRRHGREADTTLSLRQATQSSLDSLLESETDMIGIVKVSTSSAAGATDDVAFAPKMLTDGNIHTCWAAQAGDVKGAWAEFEFEKSVRISRIMIVNGWRRKAAHPWFLPSEFDLNHRVAKVSLDYGKGKVETYRLRDFNTAQFLRPKTGIKTKRIRLIVDEIYPGQVQEEGKPPRLMLSEVVFFGHDERQ